MAKLWRLVVGLVVGLVAAGFALASLASTAPPDTDTTAAQADGLFIPPELEAGVFLVASPGLGDPNFRQTVVLLIETDADGSHGLIINRSTGYTLDRVLPQFEQLGGEAGRLRIGGPVAPNQVSVLYRYSSALSASMHVVGDIYVSGSESLLDTVLQMPASPPFAVYAGYAGWAPGQLEHEVDGGNWRLAAADASFIFERAAEEVWPELIRRTEAQWVRADREPSVASSSVCTAAGRC